MAEIRARALFLGASNVRWMLPELVDAARARLGGPLEVIASHGSGRSWIGPSRVLGRGLPVIAGDAFWSFERGPARPTYALLADAGNDLAYGHDTARIAGAIERVVLRLRAHGSRTVLSGLPLANIQSLGRLKFRVASSVLFPFHRTERSAVLAAARDLQSRLESIAREHGATFVVPDPGWYGLDPIHVARAQRAEAARAWLCAWGSPHAVTHAGPAVPRRDWRALRPARWDWLGYERRANQPSVHLEDGTAASWL